MRPRAAFYILSRIIILIGVFMSTPAIISLLYGEEITYLLFLCCIGTITVGSLVLLATTKAGIYKEIGIREGFFIVSLGWILMALFGALPFYITSGITGQFTTFTDAFFESMSGFTTTGASILKGDFETKVIESLPKGILFWRSIIQWIGGMGIILFSLAVLSVLGIGGMMLYRAEVPGPVPDKISPTVSSTAKILWKVYLWFSVAEFLLLWLGGLGMNAFDAVCHTFTTMSTGGFSTKDLSMGHYAYVGDPMATYYEVIVIIFMFLSGVNFVLHYQALTGRPLVLLRNPEFRSYSFIIIGAVGLMCINLFIEQPHLFEGLEQTLLTVKDTTFTSVSILTTTGFGTADFDTWPNFSRCLILFLMFSGGSAGSTAGGIKVMRVMIMTKYSYYEMVKLLHSRAVFSIRIGKQVITRDVLQSVVSFLLLFVMLYGAGVLLLTIQGMDLTSAFSAVIASIGNIGPGLADVGPAKNYADVPAFSKWILSYLMLIGRLEIYPVLVLLLPHFWKK